MFLDDKEKNEESSLADAVTAQCVRVAGGLRFRSAATDGKAGEPLRRTAPVAARAFGVDGDGVRPVSVGSLFMFVTHSRRCQMRFARETLLRDARSLSNAKYGRASNF